MLNSALSTDANILPFSPQLVGLAIDHEDTVDGPVTIIARRIVHPELCRLCPGRGCMARSAGFCVVRVPDYVADADCAAYRLPPPDEAN